MIIILISPSVYVCEVHHPAGSGVSTFLLPGQLLCLVPDLGGVQEVRGDLDVAGCHLVDPLGDGDGGAGAAAAAAAADRRVAAG